MISVKAKRGHRRFSFRDFEIKIGRLRDLGEIGWKRNKVTYSKQYLGVYLSILYCYYTVAGFQDGLQRLGNGTILLLEDLT